MARPLRVTVPGAWYHVIARGIERRTIFHSEAYYQKFEALLATLLERFGVRLYTYVLMPNHYHLQMETPRLNLSEAMRWLNISYAVWFNRKTRRNGPLFQGRFKACPKGFHLMSPEWVIPIRCVSHCRPVSLTQLGKLQRTLLHYDICKGDP
jgi:REP element-mobilizing transposase RayT